MDALLRQRAMQSRRPQPRDDDDDGEEDHDRIADDDDEEEMASLRQKTLAKTGVKSAGAAHSFKPPPPPAPPPKQIQPQPSSKYEDDDDDDDGPAVDIENDPAAKVEILDPEEVSMREMFPISFGKKAAKAPAMLEVLKDKRREPDSKKKEAIKAETEKMLAIQQGLAPPSSSDEPAEAMIGPPRFLAASVSEEEGGSESESEDEGVEEKFRVPISHVTVLQGHTKAVTAIGLDPAGARVVTGGSDYIVKMYDFAGMTNTMRPFRELEPCGGHQIRQLRFSITGEKILVCPASARPKIIDRDGHELMEFMKGDMYLLDMNQTKGHVAAVHDGHWHPNNKNLCLTCSEDGTIRVWDIETADKKQKQVIKVKTQRGVRGAALCMAVRQDYRFVASGNQDGSVLLWDPKTPCIRPVGEAWNAHMPGSETSCVVFNSSGDVLLSRGGDDTLKAWDIRQMKMPMATMRDLPNIHGTTEVCYSPDDRLIVTGTSVRKGEGSGCMVFIDAQTYEIVRKTGVSSGSVIRTVWHPKINQIVVGSSDAKTHIFFDPTMSERGALMCVARQPRKPDPADFTNAMVILNPHALPLFRAEPSKKRKALKDRKDPIKSRMPEPPVGVAGRGGRIGVSFQASLLKTIVAKKTDREEDPREAILRHAAEAEANPFWVAPAYQATQPKTIYDDTALAEEEDAVYEVDPHTGVRKKKKIEGSSAK